MPLLKTPRPLLFKSLHQLWTDRRRKKKEQATDSPTHADTSKTTPTPFEQRFSSQQEVADYYLYAGYLCETRNDLAGALDWYKKAVLVTPNDVRLLNKIAFILIKMSLHDEAAGYAEKALSSKGDYIPALVNMGIIHAHQGNLDEALRFFESALKLDNTNTSALYNLMLLCKKKGDYMRAEDIERKLKALGHTEQQ